jgi:hypothetical protein
MYLILYSKPGCHLCEGLQEKLAEIKRRGAVSPPSSAVSPPSSAVSPPSSAVSPPSLKFELEIRDITTQKDWFNRYQYEIPVLCQKVDGQERLIPRPSPRLSVSQLEQFLQKNLV